MGPLHLAYLLHQRLPSPHTDGEQIARTSLALAQAGARVDLFVPDDQADDRAAREHIGRFYWGSGRALPDTLIVRTSRPMFGARGALAGALHVMRTIRRINQSGADAVIVRQPGTLLAALRGRLPVVFDTYRVDLSLSQDRRMALWRRLTYEHPSLLGFVAHSACAQRGLIDAGVAEDRVLLARNGHDPSQMQPRLSRDAARARLGLSIQRPIVLYAGHVRPSKGTDLLMALAARVPEVDVVALGGIEGSTDLREFRQRAASIPNLRAVVRVAPSDVAPWLYAADVLLIPPSRSPFAVHHRTVLPFKTYLYLAAGRAILAPDLADIREVLTDNHNAVLVPPDDLESAARAIRELMADSGRANRLAAAAAIDGAQWTWQARAARILSFLHRRLAERREAHATAASRATPIEAGARPPSPTPRS